MEVYIVHPNESQEKALRAFLEALNVPFELQTEEKFPPHVIEGIRKGQRDVADGRTISMEVFKEKIAAKL